MARPLPDLAGWPALVLTAGLATRLAPLSSVRAKAALPVAGAPLITRLLRWLRDAGVRRAVLNLHHHAATITRIVGDGRGLGLDVRYSWEDPVLGSAGGPARAVPLLDAERFLIVNGDTLTNLNLRALVARHLDGDALVTMAVAPGDTARYGGVVIGGRGDVLGFARAGAPAPPTGVTRHFIGVQAVRAAAFAGVPMDRPSESVRELYPALIAARAGAVQAHDSDAEFFDIGTPADYFATVRALAAREGRPLDRGTDAVIDSTARVERSILWDRVHVGAGAVIEDSIVADDVVVPAGARYSGVVVARGAGGLVVRSLA